MSKKEIKLTSALVSPRFNKSFNLTECELIGEGNFAQVYKLHDPELKRTFAFRRVEKVESELEDIHKEKAINETLKKISSPHILSIFDIIQLDTEIFYITEYCDGGSLWDTLNDIPDCKLEEREAAKLMSQICKGLQELHHHKITHRDLKPENILLTRKYAKKKEFPDIKIADFGLSTTKLIMKTVAGTKEYLSPEQAKFSSYTNAVDVWAMGIIFDELLHGSTFYTGEDNKEVFANICNVPYRVRDESVSLEIKQLLIAMLKKRPYDRPILSQIQQQLSNYINGVKIKVALPSKQNRKVRFPLITDSWDLDFVSEEPVKDSPFRFKVKSPKIAFDLQLQPTYPDYKAVQPDPILRKKLWTVGQDYADVTDHLKSVSDKNKSQFEQFKEDWRRTVKMQVSGAVLQLLSGL